MPQPLFTPGKDPVPLVQEAGWAPGPVWTGAENTAHTRILSLDCPAHSVTIVTTLPGPLFLTQPVGLLHDISPKIWNSNYPVKVKDVLREMTAVEQHIFMKLIIIFVTLRLIEFL